MPAKRSRKSFGDELCFGVAGRAASSNELEEEVEDERRRLQWTGAGGEGGPGVSAGADEAVAGKVARSFGTGLGLGQTASGRGSDTG